MQRSNGLTAMSARRRAALAAQGVTNPMSTLTRLREPKTKAPKMATRPAVSAEFSPAVVDLILDRDMHSCVRCGMGVGDLRGMDFSIQHRRARGAGGSVLPDTALPSNGVILCGSATSPHCHFDVERRRVEDEIAGYWSPQLVGGKPVVMTTVPLHHAAYGWVLLDDLGGFERIARRAA